MAAFQTYIFHTNPELTRQCLESGANGVVVDWEDADAKVVRQQIYNTQINKHTAEDLKAVIALDRGSVICRVNGGTNFLVEEVEKAIELGANEIMLPMITSLHQIEKAAEVIAGKAKFVAMVEQQEVLPLVKEFNQFPIDKVYVGLNDLAISRSERNIFLPVVDGTIAQIREDFEGEMGFAGLTHPSLGSPLPCIWLIQMMKYWNCGFSFLRRSFFRDLESYSAQDIIQSIQQEFKVAEIENLPFPQLKEKIVALPNLI